MSRFIEVIENKPQEYNAEEEEMIRKGKEFYGKCKMNESVHFGVIDNSSDPRVKLKTFNSDGDKLVTFMASAIIDANVVTCVAHEFIKDSREAVAARKDKGIIDAAVKRLNDHSHLYMSTKNMEESGSSVCDFRVK